MRSRISLTSEDQMLGRLVGIYVVKARVSGDESIGSVYLVEHLKTGIRKILKTLPPIGDDEEFAARFRQEAAVMARLVKCKAVPAIDDLGAFDDGTQYLVQEFVDGVTLRDELLRSGPFRMQRALRIAHQIAAALTEIHGEGIVHRDLSPTNIMLVNPGATDEEVKIVDFGVASVLRSQLTKRGAVLGTPGYMSPQAASGERIDPRDDVYSVSALIFEMVTGHPLEESDWPVPARIGRLLARGLEPERSRRYTMAELRDALVSQTRDRWYRRIDLAVRTWLLVATTFLAAYAVSKLVKRPTETQSVDMNAPVQTANIPVDEVEPRETQQLVPRHRNRPIARAKVLTKMTTNGKLPTAAEENNPYALEAPVNPFSRARKTPQ